MQISVHQRFAETCIDVEYKLAEREGFEPPDL